MHSPAPRTRLRTIARRLAPLMLVVLLAGCLLPPSPKTDAGQDVFNLYLIVLGLAAIVFVGVEGFILYAVVRYRRQPGDDVLPEQLHGNNTVEIIWTIIPTVIVFVLFFFSMLTLGEVEASSNVADATTVEVTGFQWQWSFRYENGAETTGTADEPAVLALPVNEPVRLVLYSLDVNHAFYVPDFLIKRDVIDFGDARPPNELTFTITEAGTYAGQCAEFCGTAHADDAVRGRGHAPSRVRRLHRGAEGRRAATGRWRHERLRDDDRALGAGHPVQHRCHRRARRRGLLHRVHEQRRRSRTTSASSRPTSTATTLPPARRPSITSRPWRPATTPSTAPFIRRR